VHYAPMRFMQP